MRAKIDGVQTDFAYTTPSSYLRHPGHQRHCVSDPEYQKKVNDRVNAYNDAGDQVDYHCRERDPPLPSSPINWALQMTVTMTTIGAAVLKPNANPYIILGIETGAQPTS